MKLKTFFKDEMNKVISICEKYSARDENGNVHCHECPYGYCASHYCYCLFGEYLNKKGTD